MIIIRVKLIYMVWDVASISKLPFCSLSRLPPVQSRNVCFSQQLGSVLSEPGGFSPGPHPKCSFNSTCQNALRAVLSSSSADCFTPTIQNASNHRACATGPILKRR